MSKHSARGPEWDAQRIRVLERDGWVCTSCGIDLEKGSKDTTVDHVDPIVHAEEGKTYRDDELVAMCRRCNSQKGAGIVLRKAWLSPRWFN